ncbi:MAG: NAD-dependent epimerase/dehydratase family protein [Anaerolineae bacterium]
MTVVVTGAAGHLGANLVRALLARGQHVRAFDAAADPRSLAGLDVEYIRGSVCEPADLRRALSGADVVYHAAAVISLRMDDWPLLESVNVHGTRHVVQACLDAGVRRLIHFSSIHALRQEPWGVPVDEYSPPATDPRLPPYDRSKAAAEAEVRAGVARGLDAVIINPTGMVGPHDYRPSFFGGVLLALGLGRMPALIASGFDWVDVRDVADGAILAAERAPAGSRYLLSGHWVSMPDTAHIVGELTGAPVPRFVAPYWLARAAAHLSDALLRRAPHGAVFNSVSLQALRSNRRISHERAARELGYHPRSFRATLADLFAFFRRQGLLAPA